MSIALLQEKIRARKTPLALVLGPEADKLPARITKNFTDMYGPGDMAQAEALRYHGSQLISQTAPLLPAVVLQAERYLHYGFMGMDVLANLVNMAKAQGLYTIVDARTAAPAVYVEGGIRADGVTVIAALLRQSATATPNPAALSAVGATFEKEVDADED